MTFEDGVDVRVAHAEAGLVLDARGLAQDDAFVCAGAVKIENFTERYAPVSVFALHAFCFASLSADLRKLRQE